MPRAAELPFPQSKSHLGERLRTHVIGLYRAALCFASDPSDTTRRPVVIATIFGVTLFAWLALWLAAFFPGVMTPDSIDQWQQATSGEYSNHHPFLHTLTIALIRKLWNSPAAVALVQMLLCAFGIGLSFRVLQRAGALWWSLAAYAATYFVMPIFGIYAVTLWKDILFSLGLLLFAVVWIDARLFRALVDRSWWSAAVAGLAVAYCACLRHNGVVIVAMVPLIALTRRDFRRASRFVFASSVILSYLFAQTILINVLHASASSILAGELMPVQLVSAVAANNGIITPEERKTLSMISPMDQIKAHYNCFVSGSIMMGNPSFNAKVLYDPAFVTEFHRQALNILIRNAPIVAADRACLAMHLIGLGAPYFAYLYETGITPNEIGLSQAPLSRIRRPLLAYLAWSERYPQRLLFWSAVPLIVLLLISCWKAGPGPLRQVTVLLLVATLAIFLIAPSRDYRYLFPLVLITPFLFTRCLCKHETTRIETILPATTERPCSDTSL